MSRKNKTTSLQRVQVGNESIVYSLTYSDRKTVGITVRSNLSVDVRAPKSIAPAAVQEIIGQRGQWILKQLQKFADRPAKTKAPTLGESETILFLGHSFRLNVQGLQAGAPGRERVLLEQNQITVWVKETKDQKRVTALIDKWYREQAGIVFLNRMLALFPCFKELPVQFPALSVRRMRSRWGSCSTKGSITLNLKLIQMDEALIDYVIMHELCHLVEHNHSKRYYALLSRMMPDWRERRERLNQEGIDS